MVCLPSLSPSHTSIMSMLKVSQSQVNTQRCDGDILCHRSLSRLSEQAKGNAKRRGIAGKHLAASHLCSLVEEEHLFTANHSNHFKRQDY